MLWYNTVSACGGPCNCLPGDVYCDCYNCGGLEDATSFNPNVSYLAVIGVGIIVVLFFLITLGFFLVYKHKKDEHPRKHAFKKSWRWWILIILLSISIFIVLYELRII